MDPLSLALGVITLIQVAAKVVSITTAYTQSVTGVPDEVNSLVSEINLLSSVLGALHTSLNHEDEKHQTFSADFLTPAMEECKAQLEALLGYLQKGRSKRTRLRNLGRRLKWPLRVNETQEWIGRMERFKGTFSLVLQNEDLGIQRKICGNVEDMKVAQEAERVEKKSEKFMAALAWLSSTDPKENHHAAQKLQHSGTGVWLTESEDFSRWKTNESSFLWLYGSAGSGKTILSSLIVDRLMEECYGLTDPKTIYFYCDFKDTKKMSAVGIYASLAAQILEHNWDNEMPTEFASYYKKNNGRAPLESSLKDQLIKLTDQIGRTRIIIDALDECRSEVRCEVLKTLMQIQRNRNINLLVTSREEIDIKMIVDEFSSPKLCIRASSNYDDIALFVKGEIDRKDSKLHRLKETTKIEVAATITSEANGMFRWAKCSLDHISKQRTDTSIRAALKSLPPGLNETYDRILADISDTDKELALRIFHWLSCSYRPMLIQELVEGIALEYGTTNLDPDSRLNDPEDLLGICGSLVTVDQDSGTVVLAHFTVKEFLTSRILQDGKHAEYFVDIIRANSRLARLCITYLSFRNFNSGACQTEQDLEARCQTNPLFPYAAIYWPQHAREPGSERPSLLSAIERFFLEPDYDRNFVSWTQFYEMKRGERRYLKVYLSADAEGSNRLIYACRLGLYHAADRILSKGYDVNAVCDKNKLGNESYIRASCGNALNAACELGDLRIVKLLLDRGADINAIAGEHELALCAAIYFGKVHKDGFQVARYLLERGANINVKTPKKTFPLRTAVWSAASLEATGICLAAGADLEMRDKSDMTMTECASAAGSLKEIFETLLEHGGGNITNPAFPWKLTPGVDGFSLFLASQSNNLDIGQRILEKDGAAIFEDPSFDDLIYLVFRFCASKGYYGFIDQMLVYSGTKLEAYVVALQEAAVKGNDKTVGVLMDAHQAGDLPGSPLVLATANGNRNVVSRLLEGGQRHEVPDEHGWTATLVASVCKQYEILDMFSAIGDPTSSLKSTPLQPTSWQTSTSMVWAFDMDPPQIMIEDGSVHLSAENNHNYVVYFDHPVPPSTKANGYYYFEVSILECNDSSSVINAQIGLISALAPYEHDNPLTSHSLLCRRSLGYTNTGEVSGVKTYSGDKCPAFSTGSIIGCAINLEKEVAYFTLNGKLIDVVCEGVKGMLYGAMYLSPGTKVKANFGAEKFLFDMELLAEYNMGGREFEKVEFSPAAEPEDFHDKMLDRPDPRFIG